MNVSITTTKIIRGGSQALTTGASVGDRHVSGNLELYAQGTVLAVRNLDNLDVYVTDFAFSGVAAVIAAAAGTGGFFLLT